MWYKIQRIAKGIQWKASFPTFPSAEVLTASTSLWIFLEIWHADMNIHVYVWQEFFSERGTQILIDRLILKGTLRRYNQFKGESKEQTNM